MKVRVRRVGTGSAFLLAMVICAAAGLLVGGLVAAAASLPLPEGYEPTILDQLGPWALAVFPAVYGLVGGLLAAVAAVLYNLTAAVTGGFTLQLSGLEDVGGAGDGEGTQPAAADAAEPSGEADPSASSRSSGE